MVLVNKMKIAASQRERVAGSATSNAQVTGAAGQGGTNAAERQEKALDVDARRRAALDAFQARLDSKKVGLAHSFSNRGTPFAR